MGRMYNTSAINVKNTYNGVLTVIVLRYQALVYNMKEF